MTNSSFIIIIKNISRRDLIKKISPYKGKLFYKNEIGKLYLDDINDNTFTISQGYYPGIATCICKNKDEGVSLEVSIALFSGIKGFLLGLSIAFIPVFSLYLISKTAYEIYLFGSAFFKIMPLIANLFGLLIFALAIYVLILIFAGSITKNIKEYFLF